jgi:hypothetical protein
VELLGANKAKNKFNIGALRLVRVEVGCSYFVVYLVNLLPDSQKGEPIFNHKSQQSCHLQGIT